ncbi:MAG: class I SAM-dependent methyltransferase [Flavobacteriia bacterium]|nr:class I SAM-dependent methyltransferase [Flavobacteriia bacterium]
MEILDYNKAPGHWVLAKLGKKVLRPGGKELTLKLINGLNINENDTIVEFAPGLGHTALKTIQKKPKKYIGIDADPQVVSLLSRKFKNPNCFIINAMASSTGLEEESVTKIYGEAMLTMHADHRKSEIIKEASRVLQKGGLYAIHEIGLIPENISVRIKDEITKDLAKAIRVNARPLTQSEWIDLLNKEGFKVKLIKTNSMYLLEPKRMLDDEGLFRTLMIAWNILINKSARKRVFEMFQVFKKYEKQMNSIMIIAEK